MGTASSNITSPKATVQSVLGSITRERLYDIARVFGIRIRPRRESKQAVVDRLASVLTQDRLAEVLRELGRDELRAVCRAHDLAAEDRTRETLIKRLADAAGIDATAPARQTRSTHLRVPEVGQILAARGRQWLIEDVVGQSTESPLLRLACLDDDAPGKPLELLWDLELGARVIKPESEGLGQPESLDPPAHFGAYLHAIKWSAVSAADASRFQAPFRAGIKLMAHQLTPLMKALELPRANLFIADDVGLGKTIEAGLVLQELILRQQAEFVLIVCPASICLQWRDEMMRRFGLRFEVMTRRLIARRRVERGFGVNPWATHNRFIISYPLIRRPEYRDPLLARLGHRAEKGLLILDEAHVAAPASASKYAVDSDTTRTVRDLAPKFDNRLFLSATPHNGHSNSFSALLEILDPIRFTRGVPIDGTDALTPVMVRRLKRDLRKLGVEKFPERILARIELNHDEQGWSATETHSSADSGSQEPSTHLAQDLGGEPHELELSGQLARYTELCSPKKGRGHLVLVNLQKRLLSSPEAFARTLEVHARALERAGNPPALSQAAEMNGSPRLATDVEAYGEDEEQIAIEDDAAVNAASKDLSPPEEATAILKQMRATAAKARRQPDGKARALMAWLRTNLCPAVGLDAKRKVSKAWSNRRVILFTEYGDTKRYLQDLLVNAIAHTDRAEERILVYHGGMGDETRDEVQRAFNTDPERHPARILLATDAAREGVNLQAYCADLFHIDVPWNPARLEQRNGRIDRTLQRASKVFCHYFAYSQRQADRVLDTLVHKIETVQRELGSVGAVLMDEMERTLRAGITQASAERINAVTDNDRGRTAEAELEAHRKKLDELEADIHRAAQRLERSRRALEVDPDGLRGVVEIGLRLSGAKGLREAGTTSDGRPRFELPEMDRSWQPTLDTLRPPRGRSEPFWEWRKRPPRHVCFEPLAKLTDDAEQLHLAHPLVRRILDRFLAQGFGAHDLSRICAVVVPKENVARVVAYARLTLFGQGAARLHDEMILVAAPWAPDDPSSTSPYKDTATIARARESTEQALATGGQPPPEATIRRVLENARGMLATLWPHLEAEADTRATEARNGLVQRARKESDDLKALLERQREAIRQSESDLRQGMLIEVSDKTQRRQVELDLEHLAKRLDRIDQELIDEPAAIERLYDVRMTRLTPIGLVVAWPESMT